MKKLNVLCILLWFLCPSVFCQENQKFTISGQISDGSSGEDLINASVFVPHLNVGGVSNVYGFYSITLEKGRHELVFSYIGYEDFKIDVNLIKDVNLDIELSDDKQIFGEVVITAEKEKEKEFVGSTEMSVEQVSIETVKKLPALFGEVDIIKVIQLLPGVKTVGEGSSGFYVRGGNVDQNLVLLDEAPIYNASHLLGFFSSFNPDAIKDMKLYKGAIPSHFGGRLSSVLDIRMKEGNSKRFAGSAGIGTLMSRLSLEAPMGKNGSFMLAGRRSYLDVVANAYQRLRGQDPPESDFYFYDLNTKVNYRFGQSNRVFASGYFGRDVLSFEGNGDSTETGGIEWGNTTSTLRWNHIFSPKLFSNLTYYYSNYDYFLKFAEGINAFKWKSKLQEHSLKADFGIYLNPSNTIRFGFHGIQHNLYPGNIEALENDEVIQSFDIQSNKSYESALYLNNEQIFTDNLKLDYGLRFSMLNNVGPQETYSFNQDFEVVDTLKYTGGIYNTYWNFEPRLGLRYRLNESSSIKASYNRTTQYIQLASNGNSSTPFDIWFSSSPYVKPQLADQIALGYFKNINENMYELSTEVYFKKFTNAIDFKDHASLLLNDNLEGELRVGEGRAYGLELMFKKSKGDLTGWVSYTLSKAEKKIESINEGNWYNAKYDKPNDLSIVAAYSITDRWSIGSSFVYSTGSAVTFPTGYYEFEGINVPIYSDRNAARLPDYHRLDISITRKGKQNKRFQTEWVLGIYNVYNRKNAFQINFKQEEGTSGNNYAEKQSIFSIVPSLTFNCKF